MSSLGPSAMLCTIGQMSKDVRQVCTAVGVNLEDRRRAAMLAAAGETTSAWGKDGITATATMGALSLLWVLAVQTGVASSAVKVAGLSAAQPPTRHVIDVVSVNLDDMKTLGAMFVGALLLLIGRGLQPRQPRLSLRMGPPLVGRCFAAARWGRVLKTDTSLVTRRRCGWRWSAQWHPRCLPY